MFCSPLSFGCASRFETAQHPKKKSKTGINIHAVQKYAKQLMAALKHMASRNLVHADIKPDNILVDQGFGSLKLADFG